MHTNAIDLHTHTRRSDGFLTPEELLQKAASYGLRAISITDHDTLSAYSDPLFAYAQQLGIELIPGIEISTKDGAGNKYHILGLLIDLKNSPLQKLTNVLKERRVAQTEKVVQLLEQLGWFIDRDQLLDGSEVVTKAHIARAVLKNSRNHTKLIAEFDTVPSEGTFIESTLIKGKPAFVRADEELSPEEAVRAIHDASGVALLAHPSFNVMRGEEMEALIEKSRAWGIDGYEAINVQYDKSNGDVEVEHIETFKKQAEKYSLLISGGSDYHHNDEKELGRFIDLGFKDDERFVPYEVLETLKEYQKKKYTVTN